MVTDRVRIIFAAWLRHPTADMAREPVAMHPSTPSWFNFLRVKPANWLFCAVCGSGCGLCFGSSGAANAPASGLQRLYRKKNLPPDFNQEKHFEKYCSAYKPGNSKPIKHIEKSLSCSQLYGVIRTMDNAFC